MDGPRLAERMSLLADEQVLVAVPVGVGRLLWLCPPIGVAGALAAAQAAGDEPWHGTVVAAVATALILAIWTFGMARQGWPVGRHVGGVLAVSSSTLLLASFNPWTRCWTDRTVDPWAPTA